MADHRCHCGQIHASAVEVTLLDGRVVSSYSEEWRAECEARYASRLPLNRRREYINMVQAKRGEEAARKLKMGLHDLWIHKKMAAG